MGRKQSDEDIERENEQKTSAVHFLRFQFSEEMVRACRDGADIAIAIDHENYRHEVTSLPPATRDALAADLD